MKSYAGPDWDTSASNNHIIPATDSLRDSLLTVEKGERIRLKGHLVEVMGHDMYWRSSDSRKDKGNGACEVFYVQELERLTTERAAAPQASGVTRRTPVSAPTTAQGYFVLPQGAHAAVKGGRVWLPPGTRVRVVRRMDATCLVKTQTGLEAEVMSETIALNR